MSATSDTAAQMTVHPPELRRFESAPGGGDEVELMDRAGQGKASDSAKLAVLRREYLKLKQTSEESKMQLTKEIERLRRELEEARREYTALTSQLDSSRLHSLNAPFTEQRLTLLEREREQLLKDNAEQEKSLRELQLRLVRTAEQDARRIALLEKDNITLSKEVDDVRVLLENEQRATAAASEKYRIAQQQILDLEERLRNESEQLQRARTASVMAASGVVHQGWMTKEGGSIKTWKKRWFVLTTRNMLNYFDSEKSTKPKGSIDMMTVQGVRAAPRPGLPTAHALEIITPKRTYVTCCEDVGSLKSWLEVLGNIVRNRRL